MHIDWMRSVQQIDQDLSDVLEKVHRQVNTEDPTNLSLAIQALEINSTVRFSIGGARTRS